MPSIPAIGNQTAFSASDPLEPFRYALEQGFDAFEWLWDEKPTPEGGRHGFTPRSLDAPERQRLRDLGVEHGLRYSVHAPWTASPGTPEGMTRLEESLEFAREIDARVLNLHLAGPLPPEEFAGALAPLLDEARTAGIWLTLENTPETTPEDFRRCFQALTNGGRARSDPSGLPVPWLGVCFDFGHALLEPSLAGVPGDFLERLGASIPVVHCHMHENRGDQDSHLPLFTGPLGEQPGPLLRVLDQLQSQAFVGSMILEQWPTPRSQLVATRDRLRAAWMGRPSKH